MTSSQNDRPKGCPDDCDRNHPPAVFALLNGYGRSTIYRLIRDGLPVIVTPTGKKVNCRAARAFIRDGEIQSQEVEIAADCGK